MPSRSWAPGAGRHSGGPRGGGTLNGRLIARPVTPGNVSTYALPANLEYSGGLNTVGIGTPVYLEADVNLSVPLSGITNVTFTITGKPIGSAAAIAPSPLPTNMGIYEPADQLLYQVAGRALLRPDVAGQYTVSAAIGTLTNGSTNVSFNITAASYMGAYVCELCHSGGYAEVEYPYWTNTLHSMIFTEGIDGLLGSYSVSCLKCHTVGYDTNASSYADNGFYATQLIDNWTFPTNLSPPISPPCRRACRTWPTFSARIATGRAALMPMPSATPTSPAGRSSRSRSPRAIATNAMTPPATMSMALNGMLPVTR